MRALMRQGMDREGLLRVRICVCLVFLAAFVPASLWGCGATNRGHEHEDAAVVEAMRMHVDDDDALSSEEESGNTTASSDEVADADTNTKPSAWLTWDETSAPNYYLVVGPAVVYGVSTTGAIDYEPLDSLGRAQGAVGHITYEMMEEGRSRERSDLSALSPSGWGHNDEVDLDMPDGSVYHGQLFNRSHLIAKSLGGDDELHNLICGTRTQNVGANVAGIEGGMAYAESRARSWLEAHPDGSLYYAATPVYQGNELLARSVLVDMRSSDGALDERVVVYNAARGFEIDYATGEFQQLEDTYGAVAPEASDEPNEASERKERQVIVTGSGRAYHHDTSCRGLAQAKSVRWVSVEEAEAMGRHPCGICGG